MEKQQYLKINEGNHCSIDDLLKIFIERERKRKLEMLEQQKDERLKVSEQKLIDYYLA